ncbi:MAG TPA: DNA-binding protein [Gammaproteobacteria bacterium]|nr:DNA-binding protein [Gammaproteobacteria bacterium]
MARPGISKQEVFEAASQLLGQGREPTIADVRQILQTGSNSTIANHLRDWRKEQEGTEALALHSNLPQEALSMMKGLWERLKQIAEDKCSLLETEHQETVSELRLEVEKYKSNNQRWQTLFNQWKEEKDNLAREKDQLEKSLKVLESDKLNLQSFQEVQAKELLEKNERIAELHRFHQQVQANLEHYRESAREQRLLDQERFAKEKQELQKEARDLKDQLTLIKDKTAVLQQEYQALLKNHSSLEQNQAQAVALIEELKTELLEEEKVKVRERESSLHWQKQYEKMQQALELKSAQYVDSQTEAKLLARQLTDIQKVLDEVLAQNKLLQNDKWLLAQEKAQLEGQAKQMQKMIHVA